MAPGGNPLPNLPSGDAGNAMSLRAEQARDQFQSSPNAESLSGGTSPIQNPDMSYAARAREGGTEAERVRQAEMLARGEQFAGTPSIPSAEPSAEHAPGEAGEETRAKPETAPEATTEEDMSARLAREAQDYAAESARFSAEVERRAVLMRAQMDEQARIDKEAREKRTAMVWNGITTPSGMTFFTGIGLVVNILWSNVSLFWTWFGSDDYTYIRKMTLPKMAITIYTNCMTCFVGLPGSCCVFMAVFICIASYFSVDAIKNSFGL